ncbi:uncharacterized protein LOC143250390 isoform X1 [Tachypleus tridentatus]|uniref:uncharacterized protein LOC143250390 isoform X1 n=1 Tax=Tachypleus tridentatus TaxID=6853 RepID=UPI003FD479E3
MFLFSNNILQETPVTFCSEIAFTKNKNAVKSGEQLTILLSTSAVDNVTCGSAVCDRSDSISPFSGESNLLSFLELLFIQLYNSYREHRIPYAPLLFYSMILKSGGLLEVKMLAILKMSQRTRR